MWKIYFKELKRNKLVLAGFLMISFLILISIFADFISPYDPTEQNLLLRLSPPSKKYILGTDDLGRDVLSRLIHGTRISLSVGIVAVTISVTVGTLVGLISGYFGKVVDMILMRFVDVMLCFPTFFLILMVNSFLEPSIYNVMIVIGLTSWPGLARLVRSECLSIKEREFILAAKALGVGKVKILFKHLLPNLVSPILVSATLGVGSAILVESGLSFLGLGVQPPTPSWGSMLTGGKDYIHFAWWLSLFPGLAILFTVLGFNLLSEGLQDVFNPRKMK